jgi:hypothetical protein
MDELLYEHGVFYTHDKSIAPNYYISFNYGCMYKGKIVDNKTVYVKNANDFVRLIKYWNTKDSNWLFIL